MQFHSEAFSWYVHEDEDADDELAQPASMKLQPRSSCKLANIIQ